MAKERTLSIIKPNAISKNVIGQIYDCFEKNHLRIIAARMSRLTIQKARLFYAVHQDKSFFESLIIFMISGPIMVQVLEGEDAINKNRLLMGDVDPQKALPHTIRYRFGDSVTQNGIHGSDSAATAAIEIQFFFTEEELHSD